MRSALTSGIWIVSLASLTVAGAIAAAFVLMATSLDPTEIISGGAEPWTNAAEAAVAFVGLAMVTVLSLALWHSTRFKIVGMILTVVQVTYVAWAGAKFYADYF